MKVPTAEQLAERNIHVFNEVYNISNDQGQKLDFKDHPFMWDIFSDFTPVQAIRKSAQIGFSTTANIKALWLAKNKGLDIIYSLPTAGDASQFVGGKTNRLIANNPIFQEWTLDKDTIEQKKVGSNMIYFRGTWVERAAIAIPADLYISDETDRSDQKNVKLFSTRLQHSKYAGRWYFSNPSLPGEGVDRYWLESDQKHWFIKCEGCGHQQYLTMDNIMGKPVYFGCVKCKKELDRRKGKWIKRWQDKEISGYWISLLMCPWVSAQEILNRKKELTVEQFCNFVLGEPYLSKGAKLTSSLFYQNLVSTVNPQDAPAIIGIDTESDTSHYVIGNKYGLFYNGICEGYTEIEKFMDKNKDAIIVMDAGGDIRGPKFLGDKYPGRVYKCFFGTDRKNNEMVKWNEVDNSVVADRNKNIQLVVDEFSAKKIPLFGSMEDWEDYYGEWKDMYRIADEDAHGKKVYRWMKPATGRCDFPFATVYWRIGMDKFAENFVSFHEAGRDLNWTGFEAKL